MNQITTKQESEKQGWLMRLLTAICEKLFAGICIYEMGISPYESQMFQYYSGYGWEEAMYQSMAQAKWDEEV